MIELSKHIEYLLLENDCVVVPELGGFIAHYQPAHYEEAEGVYLPPSRSIGFNPQLTMNDGLLVQSYMNAYHTDFPDATRKIQDTVEKLKETLYSDGVVEMHGIGILHYNIRGMYEFQPDESGVLSPSLYALDAFSMPLLKEKPVPVEEIETLSVPQVVKERKEFHLNTQWLGNAVAVAIAAVLFFVLSIPVENTYIDKGNYASLGTECLFDAIRSHSMATTLSVSPAPQQQTKKEQKHLKPVSVRVEKVAPTPKTEEKKAEEVKAVPVKETVAPAKKEVQNTTTVKKETKVSGKKHHIIVASLATAADAQQTLQRFKQKGYTDASVVEGNGRFRISLCSYTDKNEAYRKLNELKQDEAYQSAWLLSSK